MAAQEESAEVVFELEAEGSALEVAAAVPAEVRQCSAEEVRVCCQELRAVVIPHLV